MTIDNTYNFIINGDYQLYVRHIASCVPSKKVCLLFNSRSLCVESSMGIPMGSISYGDYLASRGIETFLIDLRGYGMSTSIQEQLYENLDQITAPITRESFQSDIIASIRYVRKLLGNDTEITLMGFSMLGPIIIDVAKFYPDEVQKLVILNTFGPKQPHEKGISLFTTGDSSKPYFTSSLNFIKDRLESAQPLGKNFIEPLWLEEASDRLIKFHKTFNHGTQSWKLWKMIPWNWATTLATPTLIKAATLFISSQYDAEHPLFLTERMYRNIVTDKKLIRVLPEATHLCIWEKSRLILYAWTADFIYDLEPEEQTVQ